MSSRNSINASTKAGLSNKELSTLATIAKNAAQQAGDILMGHYGQIREISSKSSRGDLVTNADISSEKFIIEYLKSQTPDIKILAEESGDIGNNSDLVWCVDPLDGTTNFAHGYPFFATSIGLTWNDIPILGSVSVPFLNEVYWCDPNKGTFCNNKQIKVSTANSLIDSLLVTGFAYDRHTRLDNNYAEFCRLTHKTRGVRRGGAAAVDLAFIACGRLDGYWERGLSPWDLAAGVSLVEMAGGSVKDYKGMSFNLRSGRVVACSKGIEEELINELNKTVPLNGHQFGAPELDSIGS